MLNDFKILSFDKVTHKLQRLKDIFNRLTLSPFEDRLKKLSSNFDVINTLVLNLSNEVSQKQEENPNWPGPNPLIPPVPPIPTLLPDLAITSVIPTVYSRYTDFAITIKNIGTALSPITSLSMVIPDVISRNLAVPSLASGESCTVHTQHSYDPSGDIQQITFLAEVNPNKSFNEISYSNNHSSVPASIRAGYLADGNIYIIPHAHNPEGRELGAFDPIYNAPTINIIEFPIFNVHAPLYSSEHGERINLNNHFVVPGLYTFQCVWNGITVTLPPIELEANTTTELFFDFPRTIAELEWDESNTQILYGNRVELIEAFPFRFDSGVRSNFSHWNGGYPDFIDWYAIDHNELSYILIDFKTSLMSYYMKLEAKVNTYPPPTGYNLVGYPGVAASANIFTFSSSSKISVDIPATTVFTIWWVQFEKIGNYPGLTLESSINGYNLLPYQSFCPANQNYTGLYIHPPNQQAYVTLPGPTFGEIGQTVTLNASLAYFMMSSIPFDFRNISF